MLCMQPIRFMIEKNLINLSTIQLDTSPVKNRHKYDLDDGHM